MIFKNPAIALLAVFIFKSAHAAEDWQTVVTISENLIFTIDRANIERTADRVSFWEKLTYLKPNTRDQASGKWIKEKKVKRVMDCKEKTQGYTEGTTYGENEVFITAVSLTEQQVQMNSIPPNTVAEKEFVIVCATP